MKKLATIKGVKNPLEEPKENTRTAERNLLAPSPSFKQLQKEDRKELDQDPEPVDP